jgi:hypothetical protein
MELRSTQHTLLQNHAVALSLQQLHSATSVHRTARHFTIAPFFPTYTTAQQQHVPGMSSSPKSSSAPSVREGSARFTASHSTLNTCSSDVSQRIVECKRQACDRRLNSVYDEMK